MSRYIDADALLEDVHTIVQLRPMRDGSTSEEIESVVYAEQIEDAPTADVVPVVRCKDCKHRDPEDKKCDCGHDILWQLPRDDDWFCADGEKVDE